MLISSICLFKLYLYAIQQQIWHDRFCCMFAAYVSKWSIKLFFSYWPVVDICKTLIYSTSCMATRLGQNCLIWNTKRDSNYFLKSFITTLARLFITTVICPLLVICFVTISGSNMSIYARFKASSLCSGNIF